MRKYDSYKESGVEWIGEIPDHWEVKKFGSISYMKGRIGWQGLKQAEFTSNIDDPFLITGMNFHDGKIRWDEVYHILKERYDEAPEIQLKESDILITKDGTIGKLLFVDAIPYPYRASLNSHLLVLRPLFDSYMPRFLYYQLQSVPFKHHVELTKTGTTFFGITQEAMGQYKALLPSSEEQTAIASYLDRKTAEIDELIADKKRLLELYEEEKIAIINQAVTKGLNPDVPMKDSGNEWLGEIPEHWEVKKGKYIYKILSGFSPDTFQSGEGTVKYFKVDDLNYLHDEFLLSGLGNRVEVLETYQPFPKGTILFPKRGAAINLNKIAITQVSCYFDTNLMGLEILSKDLDPVFLCYFISSRGLSDIADTSTIPQINNKHIAPMEIVLPPIKEQQKILDHINSEIYRINLQSTRTLNLIELLKEYRSALISEVVTGKVKVTE